MFHIINVLFIISSLLFLTVSTQLQMVVENSGNVVHSNGLMGEPIVPYCESWKLAIETNNAGNWRKVEKKCSEFVANYVKGEQYLLDSKMVAHHSQVYAKSIKLAHDGKDVWVFDVDETLLSNVQHYIEGKGFRANAYNETEFNQWVSSSSAPALPWSLWLYKKLQFLGFEMILLTGRKEIYRNSTEMNLQAVGYSSWKKLILRGTLDATKTAKSYKSEKRAELEAEGYRIHGSSGDQWSDLQGLPIAKRSFKLPNPMYHIP